MDDVLHFKCSAQGIPAEGQSAFPALDILLQEDVNTQTSSSLEITQVHFKSEPWAGPCPTNIFCTSLMTEISKAELSFTSTDPDPLV